MSEPDFNQVCSEFRQFRAIIGQALATPGDAAVKQQLQSLTATLDSTFADLQEAYPKAQAAIDEQLAGVHKTAQQTSAKLAELKDSIAAAEAAEATAAEAVPPPAPDLALGQRLREELLGRFGRPQSIDPAPGVDREIWQDWSWQDWSQN